MLIYDEDGRIRTKLIFLRAVLSTAAHWSFIAGNINRSSVKTPCLRDLPGVI